MANPQTKDGFMMIANELWEALFRAGLSGREYQVLGAIMRETYGWNRKSATIRTKHLMELTGIRKHTHIVRITDELARKNIIAKHSDWGRPTVYQLNKDFETWTMDDTCPQDDTCPTQGLGTCPQDDTGTCPQDDTGLGVDTLLHEIHAKDSINTCTTTAAVHTPQTSKSSGRRSAMLRLLDKIVPGRGQHYLAERIDTWLIDYPEAMVLSAIQSAVDRTPVPDSPLNWISARLRERLKEQKAGINRGNGRSKQGQVRI